MAWLSLTLALSLRERGIAYYVAFSLLLAALGFTAAQWRTARVAAPVLADTLQGAEVEGTVSQLAASPKGMRLTLEQVQIEGLVPKQTPRRINLTSRRYDETLHTGARVRVKAGLFPPPEPAYPGGFDFSRYFYFQGVGANGFAFQNPEIGNQKSELPISGFRLLISDWRHRLTERIRTGMRAPEGAFAAALVTGDTRAIPESVNESMRIAGIYHLLAVSGMNLAVVSGLIFFSVRFLLAAIPFVALRFNIKKIAALLSLLGGQLVPAHHRFARVGRARLRDGGILVRGAAAFARGDGEALADVHRWIDPPVAARKPDEC